MSNQPTLSRRIAEAVFSSDIYAETPELAEHLETIIAAELPPNAEAASELLAALEDVLATGLNGGNNVRLALMAASRNVLDKTDLDRADASEAAVNRARAVIARVKGGQP